MRVRQTNGAPRRGRSSVLVVEDERVVARDIETRLRDLGYRVVGIARDGSEAVNKARDLCPDVILMDVRIPGHLDGIGAAEIIRQDSLAPIIFLTGFFDQATIERARKTEPFAYLLKPFTEAELLSAIESALQRWRIEMRIRQGGRLIPSSRTTGEGLVTTDEKGEITLLKPITEQMAVWPSLEPGAHDAADSSSSRMEGPGPAAPQPAKPARLDGSETILVIGAHDALTEALERILGGRGYRVLAARDCNQALDLAGKETGPIHLVLSSIIVPGWGGQEMASQIVARHPGAKVLLLSSAPIEHATHQGDAPVGKSLVENPNAVENLLAKVRTLLDG